MVNDVYYCHFLNKEKTSKYAYPRSVNILQENARPHTAALTREKLETIHWKKPEHLLYSPDLSPCDYHV